MDLQEIHSSAAISNADLDKEAKTHARSFKLLLVFLILVMHRDSRLVMVCFRDGSGGAEPGGLLCLLNKDNKVFRKAKLTLKDNVQKIGEIKDGEDTQQTQKWVFIIQ